AYISGVTSAVIVACCPTSIPGFIATSPLISITPRRNYVQISTRVSSTFQPGSPGSVYYFLEWD
ncbi:MAG TPA: hypothetical protein VF199_08115, partial [Bacillales bacterium]